MRVYYNEIDQFAASWLANLIGAGHLPDGRVDLRDILLVSPDDMAPTSHFFAGIGGWAHALRLAGWPDDLPVWTGSCPCQPFSVAGKRKGTSDDRHLWPEWFRLIRECRPPIVFGEQVASPDGLKWLDAVSADLEGEGYAFGAADLCAAGVGAPHIRQRLYFVALAGGQRCEGVGLHLRERRPPEGLPEAPGGGAACVLDDTHIHRGDGVHERIQQGHMASNTGRTGSWDVSRIAPWSSPEWLACQDGKYRPVEPGSFPLAHGVPGRVGRLRAYGNAIVPQVADTFIRAVMETIL